MPAGAFSIAPVIPTVSLSSAVVLPHHAEPVVARHVPPHVQHQQQLPALCSTLQLLPKFF